MAPSGDSKTGRITTLIAVISVLISIAALTLSYFANRETAAVDLRAVASTNSFGSTPVGYAVLVSFSNESLRPIIIRSMELKVAGKPVAPVTSFLLDNGAGADASSLGDEPIEDGHSLPFALPERGAQTLTAFADFSLADSQAHRGERSPLLARAREFCRELPTETPSQRQPSTVELEIDFDPGETLTVPVRISDPIGGANEWRMDVTGPPPRPNGIVFWRRIASPTALRLLTVKVWTWDGHLERSVSLPTVGAAYSEVRFPGLGPDSYRAALFQDREPLAVGLFHVPLEETNEIIYPSNAQLANGECLRIKGRHNIYNYARTPYDRPNR